MKLDLDSLHSRHPRLARAHADDLALHAAVALQRRHAPGVELEMRVFEERMVATIRWSPRPLVGSGEKLETLDHQRVTELGAEALALVLVHETRGWVARRRLQREEFGDWLLLDRDRAHVALEVSGTDDGDLDARMRLKLLQVEKCEAALTRAACVVRFVDPVAALQTSRKARE